MKEFKGNLKSINPGNILDPKDDKDLESFFLILALVYNDLKDLLSLDVMLRETYRAPNEGELSEHSGEHSGLRAHLQRLIIGIVSEFLVFLKENKATIASPQFKIIELKLPKTQKDQWKHILSSTSVPLKKGKGFSNLIAQIRSTVVSHYDHSMQNIRKSFRSFFFLNPIAAFSNKAYFSLGENMAETRFYYADAAVQRYVLEILGINITGADSSKELDEMVGEMNEVINLLIREYFKRKGIV